MANYTNLADSTYDEGAPVRGLDLKALRDNIVAITEGSTNAPKIQNAAMGINSVTASNIAANAVGSSEITASAVGNSELANGAITSNKLNTALFSTYAIGTYIYARTENEGDFSYAPGASVPASNIDGISSGTWRVMGTASYAFDGAEGATPSLLLRIA